VAPRYHFIRLVVAADQPVVSSALAKRLRLKRHSVAMKIFFHSSFLSISSAYDGHASAGLGRLQGTQVCRHQLTVSILLLMNMLHDLLQIVLGRLHVDLLAGGKRRVDVKESVRSGVEVFDERRVKYLNETTALCTTLHLS